MADSKLAQVDVKSCIVKALKFVAAFTSAASIVNPIFSVANPIIEMMLKQVDDENFKNVKREFENLNRTLDNISQQNHQILLDVKKIGVDTKLETFRQNLCKQYSAYMEMVNAMPEQRQRKKDDFIESYGSNGDSNIHDLYENVVGNPVFGRPILEVYWEHSQDNKEVMKNICEDLSMMFLTGYITMMSYYALNRDDLENRKEKWEKKMKEVQEKMREYI